MGRWGMRLFECEKEVEIALDIATPFSNSLAGLQLCRFIQVRETLALPRAREPPTTGPTPPDLDEVLVRLRELLDTNDLGGRLVKHWRDKESEDGGKYRVIIAGALLMRAGAKIADSDMLHLFGLVPGINCCSIHAEQMYNEGFRSPGMAQFLAALKFYRPGTPRDFQEPSCFRCGKVQVDLGMVPMACGGCKLAWYCNKECQIAHWGLHKPYCIGLRKPGPP
ncbi:hypothetical protein F4677DRAFT_420984 [Hypoxylon crocopeplum]|nr:hypothetical protein F4677DRAFT_420984 [Hypoxylon crocopeplum]